MGKIAVNLLIDEIKNGSSASHSEILIQEDFKWNTSVMKR
jgi:hypothetical protein